MKNKIYEMNQELHTTFTKMDLKFVTIWIIMIIIIFVNFDSSSAVCSQDAGT